jgi:protein-S-isoprenylcysteine O-methyltransferase Ste14
MAHGLYMIGIAIAALLLALLVVSIYMPRYRIWPTPGDGSWQGYAFWPLFRSLNVLCFAVAVADIQGRDLGLPLGVQIVAALCLAAAIGVFLYAFRVLGRDNSYCASDGLVTAGIYQWSRNPQNTMLIVVYGCLAIAADSISAFVLCICMMAAYALMILAEEPWLEATYGDAYRRYCREVPRFFNWRRAFGMAPPSGAGN